MNYWSEVVKSKRLSLLVIIFSAILIAGVVLAGLASDDPRWLDWSFSRLGEQGTNTSQIFNLSVVVASFVLWGIGGILSHQLHAINDHRPAKLSLYSIRTLAICLFCVGIFPNDTMHNFHYIASRLLIVIFALYTLLLPMLQLGLTRKGYIMSYGVPVLMISLTIAGFSSDLSFVFFELLMGVLILVWFYAFCRSVQERFNIEQSKSISE